MVHFFFHHYLFIITEDAEPYIYGNIVKSEFVTLFRYLN